MSHRKNFQAFKHSTTGSAGDSRAITRPTTVKQARGAADTARREVERGSSDWFTVKQTRRK
jgi:hypothetical protein